jgi:hypothetical protein
VNVDIPKKGWVEISGFTHSDKKRMQIPEIIKKVPGVSHVQGEISIIIPYESADY